MLKLRLDLPEYPADAPKKWVSQGFNTVQLEIGLGGVRDVTLEGFSSDAVADIALRGGETVEMEVVSSDIHLRATADALFILNISAYLDVG